MAKVYVFYNPISGEKIDQEKLDDCLDFGEDTPVFVDVRERNGYAEVVKTLSKDDKILICGGDGTLNRFAEETENLELENEVYYYATGSGNDFWTDVGRKKGDDPVRVNEYLVDLPHAIVNGEKRLVVNGVGYGIDGYCCEEGERQREQGKEKINYTSIAIKGLLFKYRPKNAIVTVDGKEYSFKKVWLAATMNGRYYGGGMMPAPNQDRLSKDKKVSLVVFHGSGPLKTLMIFPSIFSGEHVKKEKNVAVLTGKNITVKYDKPAPLQIDGEVYSNISEYTVVCD